MGAPGRGLLAQSAIYCFFLFLLLLLLPLLLLLLLLLLLYIKRPSRRCSQYARAERKQAYIEERTQRLGFRAQSLGAESGTLSCCVATAHLACSSEGLQLQGGCVGAINGDSGDRSGKHLR